MVDRIAKEVLKYEQSSFTLHSKRCSQFLVHDPWTARTVHPVGTVSTVAATITRF
jgi:hypothetical protein